MLKTSNFNSESDKWQELLFQAVVTGDYVELPMRIVTQMKPTEVSLLKFKDAVAKYHAPWVRPLQGFIDNIEFGKYEREFKKMYGTHSQVSELFSSFRQAVLNAQDELKFRSDNPNDKSKWNTRYTLASKQNALLDTLAKVASEHPETRKHIVPLLKKQAKGPWEKGYDLEIGDVGILLEDGDHDSAQVYYPLSNIGKRGKQVKTWRLSVGRSNVSSTAWGFTFVDWVEERKPNSLKGVMDIWEECVSMAVADDPNRKPRSWEDTSKGIDHHLPMPSFLLVDDIKGRDVTVDLNEKPIRFYIKSTREELEKGRMVYWFRVHPRFKKKIQAIAPQIREAYGVGELGRILDANGITYDYHSYMDPMFD
jgi:hypothetical protein